MSRTSSKGLTLIELSVSVILVLAMLGAIWTVYITGFDLFHSQLSRYGIKDEMSLAFITMTDELHRATAASGQATAITAATAASVTFYADIDGNGDPEKIQYVWSGVVGAPLNRVLNDTTTKALVRSIQSIAFTYYNANNVLLSVPVTLANVHLVAVDATTVKGDERYHLRTRIFLQTV